MKHKQDIFSLIPRLDGFASHYDWVNHCIGATTLMQGTNPVLRPTGQMAQSVSYPDVLSRSLSVLDEEVMAATSHTKKMAVPSYLSLGWMCSSGN